jgi:sodium-coupled monocarboxylate transporter 8/12
MVQIKALDIVVSISYVAGLFGIGAALSRGQKTLKTYFLADENVHWVILSVSVLAALFSGASYLGTPAETFFHDLTYAWVSLAFFIATPITALVFLPVFRKAKIYTAYEYLERRFDRRIRRVGSALFIARVMLYLGLVIYAPSLALMEITGWPLWLAVVLMGLSATLYTAMGGMRAVIWTDSIQFIVLCGGIFVILWFACGKIPGGFAAAWRLAAADGKTQMMNLNPDPRLRLSVWSALIGGACNNLIQMVTDQVSVQRYLTAASLKDCQRALWLKLSLTLPLVALFYLTGTVLYGYYKSHPAETPAFVSHDLVPGLSQPAVGEAKKLPNDRLLPNFVANHLPSPLPGILVGALMGATIAVVSAGINSLSAAAMMDFRIGPTGDATPAGSVRSARLLTLLFGTLSVCVALWVLPHLGTIVQASITIFALFGGPLLGIFILGATTVRANAFGALVGGAAGTVVGGLVAFSDPLFGVPISFMWISTSAAVVTVVVGWISSVGGQTA